MKAHVSKVPDGQWIVGMGYSARGMKENRTPTIEELDTVSADRPVMIVDSSGHLASGYSALFKITDINADTRDPEGGVFSRKGRRQIARRSDGRNRAQQGAHPASRLYRRAGRSGGHRRCRSMGPIWATPPKRSFRVAAAFGF